MKGLWRVNRERLGVQQISRSERKKRVRREEKCTDPRGERKAERSGSERHQKEDRSSRTRSRRGEEAGRPCVRVECRVMPKPKYKCRSRGASGRPASGGEAQPPGPDLMIQSSPVSSWQLLSSSATTTTTTFAQNVIRAAAHTPGDNRSNEC